MKERGGSVRIAPVRTEADYDEVLREIDRLMDAEPGTPRGDRLDVFVTLVEAYEQLHRTGRLGGARHAIPRSSRQYRMLIRSELTHAGPRSRL